jgi:hypothetical protein
MDEAATNGFANPVQYVACLAMEAKARRAQAPFDAHQLRIDVTESTTVSKRLASQFHTDVRKAIKGDPKTMKQPQMLVKKDAVKILLDAGGLCVTSRIELNVKDTGMVRREFTWQSPTLTCDGPLTGCLCILRSQAVRRGPARYGQSSTRRCAIQRV